MAPLTDPERLAAYTDALSNWRFDGYIQFDLSPTAIDWVKRELQNTAVRDIGRSMCEYVTAGGKIDEVRETRPEWPDHLYHYDLRLTIQGKPVYIESRLKYQLPLKSDVSSITVVNIHAP